MTFILTFASRARLKLLVAVVGGALLTGCSGGGSSDGGSGPIAVVPSPTPTTTPTPASTAQPAPAPTSALSYAAGMQPGWNLGNSLESLGEGRAAAGESRETYFGNALVTQAMMNAVAAAGFKSIRIPVSWLQYADADDNISAAWLNRVAEVVDYARNAGLVVMINTHHELSWLQPSYAEQALGNARLRKFWTQIANRFRNYDENLLFAGTNEILIRGNYNAPTAENCAVQNGFNKVFVDAVRATGGNNANRFLVVQGYNTNIDYTLSCNGALPADTVSGRMMIEVHFYDPYDFALNESSAIWQWGAGATNPSVTANYGGESYVDSQFAKMKTTFIDKGVPVILGEYGAISKTQYDPTGTYRTAWDRYVTQSAYRNGIVAMYWDNGFVGNYGFGLFNRATATQQYSATVQAIVAAGQGR